jgi:integration host factor subunit alpha
MTLKKADLIDNIFKVSDMEKPQCVRVVGALLEMIKQTLESGEYVLISGFGKFQVREKSERMGRNPQTGDRVPLDARRVVTFKCSKSLRERINGKR